MLKTLLYLIAIAVASPTPQDEVKDQQPVCTKEGGECKDATPICNINVNKNYCVQCTNNRHCTQNTEYFGEGYYCTINKVCELNSTNQKPSKV